LEVMKKYNIINFNSSTSLRLLQAREWVSEWVDEREREWVNTQP
jgi:hypothetical protein